MARAHKVVAPGPSTQLMEALAVRRYRVRHDACLFFVSLLVSINIVIMPFQAYVSEAVPWSAPPMDKPDAASFAAFNASTLALNQALYSRSTLPRGVTYHADVARHSYVLRHVLDVSVPTTCASLVPGLPGAVFYGAAMHALLCDVATSRNQSWHNRGTCLVVTFLWLPIAHECLWLTSGNDLVATNASMEVTLTFALTQYPYPALLWAKFVFRAISTLVVAYVLWDRYYKHYFALARLMGQYGHRADLDKACEWHYLLVVGDPSSILVTSPLIVGVFFLDIWLSPHVIATAVLRLLQTQEVSTMLRAALYLFRMVWIAYGAMCATSVCLKRSRRHCVFAEVDPTVLVLIMTFYGPLLWLMAGNVWTCLRFCQWLLTCLLPDDAKVTRVEIILVGCVYIAFVALLPLTYGFVAGYIRTPRAPPIAYDSFRYNSFKTRALITQVHPLRLGEHVGLSFGGSIYSVFEMHMQYKKTPTMNARGSDCFLLCYRNNALVTKMRLSLLCSLDCTGGGKSPPIIDAEEPCEFHVNAFNYTGRHRKLSLIAGRGSIDTRITISRSAHPTEWCM
ncbi:hypothetical protein SPRG_09591 [Saprolegnia parasitica CBS 223.65]|uniref:Uncharacterized protein n=1 Tax=Saprolegnia parasitica (strain CBS 223.65) TaxID=695850 RepID=A0A067CDP8_SAPPC|nr:hypothetical protein SPRG_09591 [Saprolegnia parasitica CBS 223.65]KDO24947.1 hypothetical protein SPRG_09591 [Saprolegnia parasitica CBS 223.65]|eukprot:XP_012204407.1 hypothetical protein SPRG_09591 [Saprolegnia parasitica CBS 223.65]